MARASATTTAITLRFTSVLIGLALFTPALATPALATQALATQALGTRALATQALGTRALGTRALGGSAALDARALEARAGTSPARVNPKYLVCDPSEWPGSNPVYPFSFMLTTKYQNTMNANIRAAVKSIQRVIDYRVWGDQLTSPHPVFVTVDGKYGPKTAAAIKKFQKATGLVVDGKVGKQTWAKLAAFCGSD